MSIPASRYTSYMDAQKIPFDTREKLLDAAGRIIVREGVARMTLDAVSREAGVSKGGLFYHFPSKNALIVDMIRRFIDRFEDDIEENLEEDYPGSWLRAYAKATFTPGEGQQDVSVTAALIAAVANDSGLLAPLRERYELWQKQAESDGLDPELATLVRLAIDGAWMADLFGLAPPSGRLREGVLERLLQATRDGGSTGTERKSRR